MTVRRFFAPRAGSTGDVVDLPPDEAEHLSRVLRLTVGDEVRVFDGRGHEWIARVNVVEKQRAALVLVAPTPTREEPRVAITLAPAVLKGRSLDEVIRDATVLGVVRVRPMIAARSEGVGIAQTNTARVERWRRVAVAAAKQCGRAVVPQIEAPRPFGAVAQDLSPTRHRIMAVEPEAASSGRVVNLQEYQRRYPVAPVAATILIGPEGGWTNDELAFAITSGCELVTLGRRTFRADAMPLVALALFQFLWGDL